MERTKKIIPSTAKFAAGLRLTKWGRQRAAFNRAEAVDRQANSTEHKLEKACHSVRAVIAPRLAQLSLWPTCALMLACEDERGSKLVRKRMMLNPLQLDF